MTASVDQLISEIAFLKERVETLEQAAFSAPGDYVEGWADAARMLGVSDRTCRRRLDEGQFPAPCGYVGYAGNDNERPRWRRADIVRYAENREAA